LGVHSENLVIGELAEKAGVTADTLRYYERLRLIPPAPRSNGGYRLYETGVADRVVFIRKAQAMGLTLDDVREILRIADAGTPPCEHVRSALEQRLRDVEARIEELDSLRLVLARALRRSRSRPLARSCICQIIESQQRRPPSASRAAARRRLRPDRGGTHQEESS
jgi:MerR family transcriptional regulator, Zn(II)-responsive regulator of zntA